MKPKSNPFLRSALLTAAVAAFLCAPSAQATDYSYGSITENFTITASDQARVLGSGTTASGTLSADNGAVYDRGSDQDATYMHFNSLLALVGTTINGDVNLNLTVNAQYGGELFNGIIGTAASTWTTTSATPGITTFTPVTAPNATYTTGQTATWTIGNTTFSGFVGDLANFNGLGITAGDGSHAHFSAPATLTGTYTGGEIRVIGGTDWSAASWDNGTKTLSISGTSDATGGNVAIATGATLSLSGSATLGSGTFAGAIANSGTLAFGSSVNQILSGAISGSGSLEKSGAGTLSLNGSISYKGGTTVTSGTLELPGGDWSTGDPWGSGGANGAIIVGSGATLSTSNGVTGIKNGLTLNGGTVSSRGLGYDGTWGNLFLLSNITAGGTATSTIASQINLSGNRTITVDTGSTLNVTGKLNSWNTGRSGITKSGSGTLTLSGANGYNGVTDITAGTLVAANSSALGESGWSGDNMTWVRDGATLALQGGVSLPDHMHVLGAGVGGLGAIRSLSGSNALTMTYNNSGSGPGFSIDSNTTVGVDADTLTLTGFYESGGSFGLTKVGAGTLVLTQASTYTGNTLITGGTIALGNANALQNSAFDTASVNGGLDVTGYATPTLGGLTGSVDLSPTLITGYGSVTGLTLNPQTGSSVTYSGAIAEGATGMMLTKSGAGTQTLTGSNTISGGVMINGGTLAFAGGTSTIGDITNNAASLTFSGSSVVNATAIKFWNVWPAMTIQDNADVTAQNGIQFITNSYYHAANYLFLGGTLRTPSIFGSSTSWNQAGASMHFDGTRIVATADNGNFITIGGWDSGQWVNLRSTGGAVFDTAGFDIGIQVVLRNESGHNGKLTKLGAGTLTLTGNNTYTGATTITSGTLQIGNGTDAGSIGSSSSITNDGALVYDVGSGSRTYSYSISGTGSLTQNSVGGVLALSGSNSYSGGTAVNAGILTFLNTDAKPATGITTVAAGATLGLGVSGSGAFFTSANVDSLFANTMPNVSMDATSNVGIDTTQGNFTYATSVSGSTNGLVKLGANTLTLTGSNTYSGPTTIRAGTLEFSAGTSTIGNITNSGGNLTFSGSSEVTSGNITNSGGNLTFSGSSEVTSGDITNSGGNLTFSGGSVVTSGNITNSVGNITFSGSSVVTGGTLHFQSFNPQLTISDNADVTFTGGITHQPSVGGDPYHAANYIFTGGTLHTPSISGPSISWNQTGASMHFDGTTIVATADNADFITTIGWDHTNTINLRSTGGAIFDTAGFDIGIQVVLQDESGHNGKLTKLGDGTLTLTRNNTYTGTTTITSGTLQIGNGTDAGSIGLSSSITNNGALVYNVGSGNRTYSGVISGSGSLTQNSAGGILALSGSNSYSGGTAVNFGTLTFRNTDAKPATGTTTVAFDATLGLGVAALGAFFTSADVDSLFANTMTNVSMDANSNVGIDTSAGNFTYATSGSGSPTMGLVKLGDNTLTLTGSNTYTGPTTIRAGTLQIGDGTDTGSIAASSYIINNGALVYNVGAGSRTYSNNIGGNGSLTQNSAGGTLTLSGNNNYIGGTSVNAGTLELSGIGTIGYGTLAVRNGATLNLGTTSQTLGGSLNGSGAGNGAVGTISNGTIDLNGQNAYLQSGTFSMDLTGGGGSRLWIGGDAGATVELGGTNSSTYTDSNSTIIGESTTGNAGTVKLLSATALGPNGQNTQVHSGTLDLNGQTGITVSKIMLNNGNMANSNTSTAASYAGQVTFNGTTTPQIGGAGDITLSGQLTNGGFTKVGAGTLTLSGSNNYTGPTAVNNGTLKFDVSETLLGGLNIATSGTAVLTAHTGTVKVLDITGLTISGTTAFAGGGGKNLGELATPAAAPVPEPGTIGLLAAGALSIFLSRCRRK